MFNLFKEEPKLEDSVAVMPDSIPTPEEAGVFDDEVHQWQLIARSYAPPAQYIPETLQDAKLVEKAMFGVTTILLQDINTGAIRKEEILGSDENQLFVILDKADRYGMQYVPFNGKRFAVALVPPEDNVVA